MPLRLPVLTFGLLVLLACAGAAQGANLTVLSGEGAKAAIGELAARFERATGNKVTIHFEVNSAVKQRILAGEPFDVAFLNPPVLDDLIRRGRIVPGTRAVLGRSGICVAARAGTPKPDISSVESFKRTLVHANSVAYPEKGASGIYFAGLIDRLGIASDMRAKLRPMPAEDTVEVVARGEVDLVVVVASRISGVPGIERVGLIPQELQTWIGFTAGVGTAAKEPAAAHAMIQFFTAPAAAPVFSAAGIEPFVE